LYGSHISIGNKIDFFIISSPEIIVFYDHNPVSTTKILFPV
jgi:hypothetical protein